MGSRIPIQFPKPALISTFFCKKPLESETPNSFLEAGHGRLARESKFLSLSRSGEASRVPLLRLGGVAGSELAAEFGETAGLDGGARLAHEVEVEVEVVEAQHTEREEFARFELMPEEGA